MIYVAISPIHLHLYKKAMKITTRQYRTLLVIWIIIVLLLLLLPQSSFAHANRLINFPHKDKIAHFCLFGVLSFLLFKNLEYCNKVFKIRVRLLTITLIFSFGLLTEILQEMMYNTSKRNFSLADLFFDTLACVVVMIGLYLYKRRH